jgi:hypothetical protein
MCLVPAGKILIKNKRLKPEVEKVELELFRYSQLYDKLNGQNFAVNKWAELYYKYLGNSCKYVGRTLL